MKNRQAWEVGKACPGAYLFPFSELRMPESTLPFVTIVMPALDEERYIASAIASVIPDEGSTIDYEVIVADGGSVDATAKIVRMLARGNHAIRLVENVGRTQAAGVNLAARLADPRSSVLVRADCHAGYPADFVVTCVAVLGGTAIRIRRRPHADHGCDLYAARRGGRAKQPARQRRSGPSAAGRRFPLRRSWSPRRLRPESLPRGRRLRRGLQGQRGRRIR